jgi:hypothetical protein
MDEYSDMHTLMFFLEVLGMGRKLLYRGQVNAD